MSPSPLAMAAAAQLTLAADELRGFAVDEDGWLTEGEADPMLADAAEAVSALACGLDGMGPREAARAVYDALRGSYVPAASLSEESAATQSMARARMYAAAAAFEGVAFARGRADGTLVWPYER